MDEPKYIRADVLIKEFRKKVPDYTKLSRWDYDDVMCLLEEELILELAEKIKEARKNNETV